MRNGYFSDLTRPLCVASTGSMTSAIKARRTLAAENIEVKVKKVSGSKDSRGCIYGIEFSCELSGNVLSVLRRAGVEVFI